MTPAPVGLLKAERVERVVPRVTQADLRPCLRDRVVDVPGQVGRYQQLEAEFADVGDGNELVRPDVLTEPVTVAADGSRRGEYEEFLLGNPVDGDVGLDPAP